MSSMEVTASITTMHCQTTSSKNLKMEVAGVKLEVEETMPSMIALQAKLRSLSPNKVITGEVRRIIMKQDLTLQTSNR